MSRPRHAQSGFAMIDAMAALGLLAFGLLGLGEVMARQLAEVRATNARAVALQHIGMLADGIAINPAALADGRYLLAWDATRAASADCAAGPCTAAQLADFQLAAWLASLKAALPGARATVFSYRAGSTAVAIAWPANERQMDAEDTALQAALFAVTVANSGIDCPARFICQVGHVAP